ncbi:unnamed protein product [Ilex paraguariensis]|uniref:Uncharacterized protein n=1 Tax=Ilex paraguariensis TaxID=185542 RepID=A0ABC8TXJ6_9AQUA
MDDRKHRVKGLVKKVNNHSHPLFLVVNPQAKLGIQKMPSLGTLGNPQIREALSDVPGGLESLECVGFDLRKEDISSVMKVMPRGEASLGLLAKSKRNDVQ